MHLVFKQKLEMVCVNKNTFAVAVPLKMKEKNDFDLDEIYSEFLVGREDKVQKYYNMYCKRT